VVDDASPIIEPAGYEPESRVSSPAGLVFTTAQRQNGDGTYAVVACVANVGRLDAKSVDVAFTLDASSAAITLLRAPSAPGEVSAKQARAIISQLPPNYQTQLEITVRASDGFSEAHYDVMVPKAYRLTNADPKLRCMSQGENAMLPELIKAEFTVGGDPIDVRAAVDALRGGSGAEMSAPGASAFMANASGATIPVGDLMAGLLASAAFIFALGVIALAARRH
jgi:hypothetical protein